MELRVLKYFITVAREESFSKAAKLLNVSQPALSKQIKDLEDEYKITLFNRTTRTVSLTEEGRLFKEQAIEILNLVDRSEDYLRNNKKYISGNIHIGCSESICNRVIMKAIAKTQNNIPILNFIFIVEMLNMLRGKIDQSILI